MPKSNKTPGQMIELKIATAKNATDVVGGKLFAAGRLDLGNLVMEAQAAIDALEKAFLSPVE